MYLCLYDLIHILELFICSFVFVIVSLFFGFIKIYNRVPKITQCNYFKKEKKQLDLCNFSFCKPDMIMIPKQMNI